MRISLRTTALLAACVLSLAACDTSAPELGSAVPANAAAKSDVCHATGSEDNPYVLITIADAALPAHVAHGDAQPGDAVPGMTDVVFDDTCTPQEVAVEEICPCFTSADLQQQGSVAVCGDNFSGFPDLAGIIFDNGASACSGTDCGFEGPPSCTFSTGEGSFLGFPTPEEDSACRAIILQNCPNPNAPNRNAPNRSERTARSTVPFMDL